jgi:transposase
MALKVIKASGGKSADFDPKAEAVRLYEDGKSLNAVAALLAVSNNTVRKWLMKADIQRRSIAASGSLAKAPDPLDVERAVKAYRAGRPARAVAAMAGVSKATVQRWLAAAGVQPRPEIGVSKATVNRWLHSNTPETSADA